MKLGEQMVALERSLYTRLRAKADARLVARAVDAGRRPKPSHLLTWERGEDAAYFYLRSLGYTIVARRWRTPRLRGDIDLLGWDGDTLVAFEIKTRTQRDFAPAEIAVDRDKRNQLRRQLRAYLHRIPEPFRDRVPVRFDVVAVYLKDDAAEFEHFRASFPLLAPREDRPLRWNRQRWS